MFSENVDPDRDLANVVTLQLKNNRIRIRQSGPHAWWTFRPDHGKLPAHYKGWFTTLDAALQAAKAYCNKNNLDIVSEEYLLNSNYVPD